MLPRSSLARWVLLGAALLLQGCASKALQNVAPDYQLSATKGEGLIILSAQFVESGCASKGNWSTAYLGVNPAKPTFAWTKEVITLTTWTLPPPQDDPTRRLYIRRLEAGQYWLGEAHLVNFGNSLSNRTARMPFTVEAGQAYYLGEVTVTARDCHSLDISVDNQRQRDMRWLAPRLNIRPEAVKDQVVQIHDAF